MWAVQFCPPAPLKKQGLVSYRHESFFCFYPLLAPSLSLNLSRAWTDVPTCSFLYRASHKAGVWPLSIHGACRAVAHAQIDVSALATLEGHFLLSLQCVVGRSALRSPFLFPPRKAVQNILPTRGVQCALSGSFQGAGRGAGMLPEVSGNFWYLPDGNLGTNPVERETATWGGWRSGGFSA